MTLRHRIRFYQQLAVLARAGLPLRNSLLRLKEKMNEKEVTLLSQKVNEGERIGDAFTAAGFTPFECHLVAAGEKSARLDTIFQHLSEFWVRELEMRQALIRPLYYPIGVLHLAILIGAVVEAVTISWPVALTHAVMGLALLYALGFVVYTVIRISWPSPMMRYIWLRTPIIGKSLTTAYAYRWITVLQMEFSAGVSLYRAVGDAWRASGHIGCERLAEEGEQAMLNGADLSKLVLGWKQLPRDWIDFIETGEISGALDETFKKLEEEAALAWTLAQQRMTEWVPKILYFIVLLIVATVVARLMYQVEVAPINDALKQIGQ